MFMFARNACVCLHVCLRTSAYLIIKKRMFGRG